jgi:hypothetical protein
VFPEAGLRAQGTRVLTAQHLLTIPASADGRALAIGDISTAARMPDGKIVIGDSPSKQLHLFDGKGSLMRSVGRAGEGPGEMRSVQWVGACGGTDVTIYDRMLNRLTAFAFAGNSVDRPDARVRTLPVTASTVIQCDGTGRMAVAVPVEFQPGATGNLLLFDRTGTSLGSLGPMFLDEGRPLGTSIKLTLGGGRLMYGAGDSAFMHVYELSTKRTTRMALPHVPRAPTEANRTATIEYWATLIRGTERDYERMRTMLRRMPPAKTVPVFSGLFFDEGQPALWVQTSVLGDANTVLDRYTPDGRANGRLLLPPDLLVYQVSGGVVVARCSDADTGEQSLVMYRVAR